MNTSHCDAMRLQENYRQAELDQLTDPWLTCPVGSTVICDGQAGCVVSSRARIRVVKFADGLIDEVPLDCCREICAWEWNMIGA